MIIFSQLVQHDQDKISKYMDWFKIGKLTHNRTDTVAPHLNSRKADVIFGTTRRSVELSIWFNDNVDASDVAFNTYDGSFFLKNEVDVVAFKLRWL